MKTAMKIGLLAAGLLAGRAYAKDVINYEAKAAFPEGIAYDAKADKFLVSSMHLGTIGAVGRDGKYVEFIKDDSLVSSVGMTVDAKTSRLLVCVSDPGASVVSTDSTKGKLARLVVFDLATKKRLSVIDLGGLAPAGGHFANDLTLDDKGNTYVTDSFSPIIYKVDPAGKASIFVQNDMFKGEGFNLNGIVFHPKGYLLVLKYNSGDIYKISTSNPADITKVAMKETFSGADGLLLLDEKTVVLVQNNGANKVHKITSADGWKTASVAATTTAPLDFPTTAVMAGKKIYVNNVHLGELFDPKAPKDRSQFSIEEVEFSK